MEVNHALDDRAAARSNTRRRNVVGQADVRPVAGGVDCLSARVL